MIKHINTKEELTELLNSNEKVLLDFYATWCGPCRMLAPILEEIDEENTNIQIVKVDVDEATDLAISYGIQAIPTLIYFYNKEIKNKFTGFMRKEQIEDFCN